MAPAQPSAPLPPDTSTPLSTRIPSVRKPVHDTLRMYPKPSHSDLFCCHPAWCRPVSCQFWWPWQYACVSLLCAVPFTATEGLFPHSGNSCLPCYSLHLEQSPDLVVAFEAPPWPSPLPVAQSSLSILPSSAAWGWPRALPCPGVAGGGCWRSIISNII